MRNNSKSNTQRHRFLANYHRQSILILILPILFFFQGCYAFDKEILEQDFGLGTIINFDKRIIASRSTDALREIAQRVYTKGMDEVIDNIPKNRGLHVLYPDTKAKIIGVFDRREFVMIQLYNKDLELTYEDFFISVEAINHRTSIFQVPVKSNPSTNFSSDTSKDSKTYSIGDKKITLPYLILGKTESDWKQLVKYASKNDTSSMMGMAYGGRAFIVEDNTKAEIIDRSGLGLIKVRILTGEQKGKIGWLSNELL